MCFDVVMLLDWIMRCRHFQKSSFGLSQQRVVIACWSNKVVFPPSLDFLIPFWMGTRKRLEKAHRLLACSRDFSKEATRPKVERLASPELLTENGLVEKKSGRAQET